MTHGVGERLLRDADDLAVDAAAERRQLVDGRARSARRSCGARDRSSARSAAATSSPSCGLRAQRRHRSARVDHVRPRQIDRGLEALRHGRRQRPAPIAAPPAAASGWRRTPARACRGCRAPSGCAPRAPPDAALRRGSVRRAGSGAAPASPAAPSLRAAPAATRLSHSDAGPVDSATHPRLRVGSTSGAMTTRFDAGGAIELLHRLGQPRVVARVLDRLGPAVGVYASRCAAMLSRGSASVVPVVAVLHEEAAVDVGHPEIAAGRRRRSSSQTPQAWLSDSSTSALMNARKKPVMSGSRTRSSQRELHGVALDVRHALGAAAIVDLARQRARSVERRLIAQRMSTVVSVALPPRTVASMPAAASHAADIRAIASRSGAWPGPRPKVADRAATERSRRRLYRSRRAPDRSTARL